MKTYRADAIHNVTLLSHGGVGKTSLAEAICFTAKATKKLGSVDAKTSLFDTRPDEKDRGMTISTTVGSCEWNNAKINLLDTPGFLDYLAEAKAALAVTESAVILVDAFDGVQVGTEISMRYIEERGMSRIFFINGMDRENANFEQTLESVKTSFGTSVAPVVIPIGSGADFKGVIDLVTKEAFEYQSGGNGMGKKIEIPADMNETVETMRMSLMESVAESDETLMNNFFENGELSDDELRSGLAQGVLQGLVFPLLSGSALNNMGVDQLLYKITNLTPPASSRTEVSLIDGEEEKAVPANETGPTTAFVFKTISEDHLGEVNLVRVFSGKLTTGLDLNNTIRGSHERIGSMYTTIGHERHDASELVAGDIGALLKLKDTHTNDSLTDKSLGEAHLPKVDFPDPLVSIAITSKTKGDEDKMTAGIHKLNEEDALFTFAFHSDIHQSILSAMGDIQIDIILGMLKSRFKVEVEKHAPKISYRETITKPVKYVEYTHKKQTGGAGQYAKVYIDMEPAERGGGYEFIDKIVGGVIDQTLRPSVNKGINAKMTEGILAGFPIVDVKVSLVDGKTHPVDSKDVAFQIAGREVFKKAFEMASPILLEPMTNLQVTVPDEYTGDVVGDLSSRRGRISGMEPQGKYQVVSALVPESEVQSYSQSLRSFTQGRGFFTKSFSHYEPMPPDVTQKIVEQTKAAAAAE